MKILDIIKTVLLGTDKKYLYNSHRTFTYKKGVFYSYSEPIGSYKKGMLCVNPKTARLGFFISYTTSKHVNYLIQVATILDRPFMIGSNHYDLETVDNLKDYTCPITLDKISEGAKTECGHIFSTTALKKWLKTHPNCPVCRATI